MRMKQVALSVCISLLIGVFGCSDKKDTDEKTKGAPSAGTTIYDYIPTDSPYVWGNMIPMPEAYLNKMFAKWQTAAPLHTEQLKKLSEQTEKPSEKGIINLANAILAEMATIKTAADMDSQWGLSPDRSWAFYGLGLLPAARIEVTDRQKVEQLLSRLEEKSGQKMTTGDLNGQSYRFLEIKEKIHLKVVLAVTDYHLIGGLIPGEPDTFNRFLPMLLGVKKPSAALGLADFKARLSDYNFPGYGDGYVDIEKIAAILRGEGEGLNRDTYQILAPKPDEPLQIGCTADFDRGFFAHMPRLIFGLTALTEAVADVEMVLELSPAVIETIKKLPKPIPAIASKAGPMFALGVGADIPELRMGVQRLLQYIIDNNKDCPKIDTAKLKEVLPKLNLALNPMISGLTALIVSLDQMETDASGKPVMDNTGACIALEMNDPRGLVAMGAAFVPALAELDIPADGTPVPLALDALPIKIPGLFVAIKAKRLVLSMGKTAQERAREAMAGEALAGNPLYWMSYQTSAWEALVKSGLSAAGKMNASDRDEMLKVFDRYKEMIKGIHIALYVTDQGLSIREKVMFN